MKTLQITILACSITFSAFTQQKFAQISGPGKDIRVRQEQPQPNLVSPYSDQIIPGQKLFENSIIGTTWDTPNLHVGPADCKGCPSYAPLGPNGEIIAVYKYVAFTLNILNLAGHSVYTNEPGRLEEGQHLIRLDVLDLTAGIYYCMIKNEGIQLSKKFIVFR